MHRKIKRRRRIQTWSRRFFLCKAFIAWWMFPSKDSRSCWAESEFHFIAFHDFPHFPANLPPKLGNPPKLSLPSRQTMLPSNPSQWRIKVRECHLHPSNLQFPSSPLPLPLPTLLNYFQLICLARG